MEILRFIAWRWRTWEFWQKCFVIVMPCLPLSLLTPAPWDYWLSLVPMMVVFGFILKWAVWDSIHKNWLAYKKSRQELFDTIRDSDR